MLPLQGLVPAGQSLDSPDDPSVRSTVISRWPDGSASVVVVAGETVSRSGLPNKSACAQPGQRQAVDACQSGPTRFQCYGRLRRPWRGDTERLHRAGENLVGQRASDLLPLSRAAIGAHPTLEAVIDIHAFSSNRALVEIVIENCKMVTATPIAPAAVSYTAAVTVNGAAVATVQSTNGPGGTHQPFRAWYASSWVGGDPGIDVTHDTGSMQAHPLFFRTWKSGGSMAAYAADAYEPWGVGRHPANNMGAGGDAAQIGPTATMGSRSICRPATTRLGAR